MKTEERLRYELIFHQASMVASEAALKWLKEEEAKGPKYSVHSHPIGGEPGPAIGYMLDVCGGAWIGFRKRTSKVYKACKEIKYHERLALGDSEFMAKHSSKNIFKLPIRHTLSGRQEMGLHVAAMEAALEYLKRKLGDDADSIYVHSYID